jgi:predicted SAM-dependent methyltransferase
MTDTEKRILNVGCGSDTYGTDRVDIKSSKATTKVHDLEYGIPYSSFLFDEVYSKNNLEHLRNPGYHLSECWRVLKNGGKIRIWTDNALCAKYAVLGTHSGVYEFCHKNDKHYCLFTVKHLQNHLEAAGFKEINVKLIDTTYPTKWFDYFIRMFWPKLSYPRIQAEAVKS